VALLQTAAVGIGQGKLRPRFRRQPGQDLGVLTPLLFELRDLLTQARHLRLPGLASSAQRLGRRLGIGLLQGLQIALRALVDVLEPLLHLGLGEVARGMIDRLQKRPVDGHQFPAKEPQPPAQPIELPKHRLEARPMFAPEIVDRPVVRRESSQQPDDFQVAVESLFPNPGSNARG
jgi:hypothetical protein